MLKNLCIISILLFISMNSYSKDSCDYQCEIDQFINNCKYSNLDSDLIGVPDRLRFALESLLYSPLGANIIITSSELGEYFEFTQVAHLDDAFTAEENQIYYHLDVSGWYVHIQIDWELPLGSNLEFSSLASLIAHEIGHTALGRASFNLPEIESFVEARLETGGVTYIYSRERIQQEEFRAVRLFENIYRSYANVPLRYAYYKDFDIINP